MYWILSAIIIVTLLMAPTVVANPLEDLWNWLFGSEEEVDIGFNPDFRIIDGRTEELCDNEGCLWTQHKNEKFMNINNVWRTFDNYSTSSIVDSSLVYTYLDGTIVTLEPFVIYNGDKIVLNSISTGIKDEIDYSIDIEKGRDSNKFTTNIKKIEGLTSFGFKVTSNNKFIEVPKIYKEGGVFDLNEDAPEEYSVTDLRFNNVEFSYYDLIENGYDVTYSNGDILIDISDKTNNEVLSLDPVYSTFSPSIDGHFGFDGISCTDATNNSEFMTISYVDDLGLSPAYTFGVLDFDTSSIPDEAIIDDIRHRYYVNSLTYRLPPRIVPSSWIIRNQWKDYGLGETLSCADFTGFTKYLENDFIGTALSWINYSTTNVSVVNVTGNTTYRLRPLWNSQVTDGYSMTMELRATEYIGAYDPSLEVYYSLGVCTNGYTSGDFIVTEEVNCTAEEFEVTGMLNVTDTLNLYNQTNMTLNQSRGNLIHSGDEGMILIMNNSKLI